MINTCGSFLTQLYYSNEVLSREHKRSKMWFLSCPISSVFNISWFVLRLSWLWDTLIEKELNKELNSWNDKSGVAARPSGRNKLTFSWLEKKNPPFSKGELDSFLLSLWGLKEILTEKWWVRTIFKGSSFCWPSVSDFHLSRKVLRFILGAVNWIFSILWLLYCSGADSWSSAPARVIIFSLMLNLSFIILQENLFSSFLFHQHNYLLTIADVKVDRKFCQN